MSKFDFSPEALDQGLTEEDVNDFTDRTVEFKTAVAQVNLAEANAEQVRDVYDSWLKVGQELFHIATKLAAAKAVKESPPSVKTSLVDDLLARFGPLFDRFKRGK